MRPPLYQRAVKALRWIVLGSLAVGGILSALSNAARLISPKTAAVLTVFTVLISGAIELYTRRHPLLWILEGGKPIYIRRLGWGTRVSLLGVLALFWVGAGMHDTFGPPQAVEERSVDVVIADDFLSYDSPHEIVYYLPPPTKQSAFVTTYLPLQLANTGKRTVENLTVALRYPNSPHVSITRPMRHDALGIKEED